jgi:hypothetical protein
MVMMSPYADSLRRNPQLPRRAAQAATMMPQQSGGLGALFRQMGMGNLFSQRPQFEGRPAPQLTTADVPLQAEQRRIQELRAAQPANPFEGNEQYQALMEFQQSLAPSQEQQQRLQELQSAFEGTGAYKDYRINQLQNQLQQRQFNPRMGMGLGGMRPMGMQPYQGFGRPPMMQQPMPMPRGGYNQYQQQPQPMRQFGAMGYNQPQQQYMNPYQQMRPQPQQFGGYGMGQQMGGYGSYGQMPNPYQPQQMGYNTNNYSNYAQPAQNQFQGYGGMQAQSQGVF